MGFRISGLGFRISGLGFRVWGSAFEGKCGRLWSVSIGLGWRVRTHRGLGFGVLLPLSEKRGNL